MITEKERCDNRERRCDSRESRCDNIGKSV